MLCILANDVSHWIVETERFFPLMERWVLTDSQSPALNGIGHCCGVITSYTIVNKIEPFLAKRRFCYCVLDRGVQFRGRFENLIQKMFKIDVLKDLPEKIVFNEYCGRAPEQEALLNVMKKSVPKAKIPILVRR
jgi:hypothetical protein